ncbi:hypothetical protein DPQ33_01260 [Oceanidesulfovibrio indonesiensis]|uniref:EF-hand domain-containing protein n=1 Tax=Oceanidesulfovibrio indonesiensis TaxID=54767 RepID=A0A7M3MKJ2_9BACT|nr:EF-hand domain-containing protein [Oceanidesulfovibrio indonesiensis]TVM19886.1 hypothetical protein DPQ33_01260 [Oceanidesulfovibrio indonesiensis]
MMRAIALACLLAAAVTAFAATDRYPADFSEMDLNNDGVLTWDEFHAYYPELSRDAFDGADQENDGRVTPEEWQEFIKKPR